MFERSRQDDNRTVEDYSMVYTYPNGTPRKSTTYGSVSVGLLKTMNDIVVPGYKKKVSQGLIFNNPMTRVLTEVDDSPYPWYNYLGNSVSSTGVVNPNSGFVDNGTMPVSAMLGSFSIPVPSLDVQDLVDIAVNQAWAGIDKGVASGLVTIAEAKKTYASVASIIVRSFGIFRAVKRADIAYLRKEISYEELANRYLELRYAIRPLAYDLKSVVEAHNTFRSKADRKVSRGKAEGSNNTSASTPDTGAFGSTYVLANGSTYRDVKVRAGVMYTIDASKMSQLQTWGLLDISGAAWELVPFSFIIDWFITVGTTIAAWSPKPYATVLASWVVIDETVATSIVTSPAVKPDYYVKQDERGRHVSGGGSYTIFTSIKTRIPSPARSILPSFDINLNFLKILDLVLILQKLKR